MSGTDIANNIVSPLLLSDQYINVEITRVECPKFGHLALNSRILSPFERLSNFETNYPFTIFAKLFFPYKNYSFYSNR